MEPVVMPQLGETVTEGTITRWLKQVGDTVAADEALFEVSTDKVDTEVPSAHAGVLRAIHVPEGATVPIGTLLAVIAATADEPIDRAAGGPAGDAAASGGERAAAADTVATAPAGASGAMASGAAASLRDDEVRAEAPTGAAASELVGAGATPGGVGGQARVPGGVETPGAGASGRASEHNGARGQGGDASAFLSPVVARLLAEHGLHPSEVVGSGRDGRITRADVLAAAAQRQRSGAASPNGGRTAGPASMSGSSVGDVVLPAPPGAVPPGGPHTAPLPPGAVPPGATPPATFALAVPPGAVPLVGLPPAATPNVIYVNGPVAVAGVETAARTASPPPEPWPDDEIVELTRARRNTAEHMTRSLATSAHTLVVTEVDYEHLEPVRKAAKLSYLPFVARAVIDALREFPHLNASLGADALYVHQHVNLGFAVDVRFEALVVPVVKRAEELRLRALSDAVAALAEKARTKRLGTDDLTGGTFSITNVGQYGTVVTFPVINQPQVAILSTDGVRMKPVAVPDGDGGWTVVVHPIGNLSLTFDHRAVDGAYASAFLAKVRDLLQTRDWTVEVGP